MGGIYTRHLEREEALESFIGSATRGDLEAILRHRTFEGHALRRKIIALKSEVRRLNMFARNNAHADMRVKEVREEMRKWQRWLGESQAKESKLREKNEELENKVKALQQELADRESTQKVVQSRT